MFRILTMTILVATSSIGLAQSPDTEVPMRLLGFFTPGMHVGIQSVEGSTNVIVYTYSEADFAVAKEIARRGRATIDAEEFATRSEPVRIALEQHLKKSDPATSSEINVWVMPLLRTTLGRVKAVGDDYILIEIDGEAKARMAIADLCVSKVYLDATPIRFLSRPSRTASSDGG
jgi:hypothetical protein